MGKFQQWYIKRGLINSLKIESIDIIFQKCSFFLNFGPLFPKMLGDLIFSEISSSHFSYIHQTACKRIEKTNGLFLIKTGDTNADDKTNNCGTIGYPTE